MGNHKWTTLNLLILVICHCGTDETLLSSHTHTSAVLHAHHMSLVLLLWHLPQHLLVLVLSHAVLDLEVL